MSEKNDFRLITDLSVATCIERLRGVTDEQIFRLFGRSDSPVLGTVKESSFVWRKRLKGKNSFQMLLHGRLTPKGSGTQIDCHAAMAKSVKVFMAFWFAMVITFCFFVLFEEFPGQIDSQVNGQSVDMGAFVVLIPFGMLLFGVLLVWGGRFLARNDSDFMRDLLCRTLDAKVVDQPPAQNRRAQDFPVAQNRTVER